MNRFAKFSVDRKYRYFLVRTWDHNKPQLTFITMHADEADEKTDSYDVKKCIDIAKRHGFGAICIVCVFARITGSNEALATIVDPVGVANDMYIRQMLSAVPTNRVILAWGTIRNISKIWVPRYHKVSEMAFESKKQVSVLGLNNDGSPLRPKEFLITNPLIDMDFFHGPKH